MNKITKFLKGFSKLKFKILGHATIKDIPTDQFNELIESLISEGWKKTFVYDEFDAWIDYGKVILKNNGCRLTFEWDNWSEGSLEGPKKEIKKLALKNNLKLTNKWRGAEYDEMHQQAK